MKKKKPTYKELEAKIEKLEHEKRVLAIPEIDIVHHNTLKLQLRVEHDFNNWIRPNFDITEFMQPGYFQGIMMNTGNCRSLFNGEAKGRQGIINIIRDIEP